MRAAFYGMVFASLGVLAWQVAKRARLWRQGQPGDSLGIAAVGASAGSICAGAETGSPQVTWRRAARAAVQRIRRPHHRDDPADGRRPGAGQFHRAGTTCFMNSSWMCSAWPCASGVCWRSIAGFRRPVALGHQTRDWALLGLLLHWELRAFSWKRCACITRKSRPAWRAGR